VCVRVRVRVRASVRVHTIRLKPAENGDNCCQQFNDEHGKEYQWQLGLVQ